MNALVGSLEAFALPDVFKLLSQNAQTGALNIKRDSGDGVVFFRDGEVYFAASSLTREFLGQRLLKAKVVSNTQLLRLLDEVSRRGDVRLGDVLLEQEVISPELLDTFLKEQIQDAIFGLLQWEAGTFTFELGAVSDQEVGLSVSVENLLMESSRRLEEWEVIQRKIPNLEVVLRMSPTPPEDTVEINIKPEEWSLLVSADGERTVRQIAAESDRSEFEACKVLYGLLTAGLLQVVSGATSEPGEEPSRVGPMGVDAASVNGEAPETLIETLPAAPVVRNPEPMPAPARKEPPVLEEQEDGGVKVEGAVVTKAAAEPLAVKVHEPAANRKTPPKKAKPVSVAAGQGSEISKETLLRLISGVRSL